MADQHALEILADRLHDGSGAITGAFAKSGPRQLPHGDAFSTLAIIIGTRSGYLRYLYGYTLLAMLRPAVTTFFIPLSRLKARQPLSRNPQQDAGTLGAVVFPHETQRAVCHGRFARQVKSGIHQGHGSLITVSC